MSYIIVSYYKNISYFCDLDPFFLHCITWSLEEMVFQPTPNNETLEFSIVLLFWYRRQLGRDYSIEMLKFKILCGELVIIQ